MSLIFLLWRVYAIHFDYYNAITREGVMRSRNLERGKAMRALGVVLPRSIRTILCHLYKHRTYTQWRKCTYEENDAVRLTTLSLLIYRNFGYMLFVLNFVAKPPNKRILWGRFTLTLHGLIL
jgi:hypothetical protein